MTYKDIRSEIESYEKKQKEAFMIYGDHGKTEEKKELYLRAKNKKDAALAALFDFCKIYRYRNIEEDEELKKYYSESIKRYDEASSKGKDFSIKEEFDYVYGKTLYAALSLEGKDYLMLLKYGEEKRKQHLSKDKLKRNRKDNKSVNNLFKQVMYNYEKYKSDKKSRMGQFFHVGTSKDEMQAYYDLITKEEVMYTILLNAINDAKDCKKSNFVLSKELIENSYKHLSLQTEKRERFFDEDAYSLSRNGYPSYENAFERVYDLSGEYEEKLVKKLDNKINNKSKKEQ